MRCSMPRWDRPSRTTPIARFSAPGPGRPDRAAVARVAGHGLTPPHELIGEQTAVLAEVHHAVEDQQRDEDRDDGPEDPGPERREPAEPDPDHSGRMRKALEDVLGGQRP